MKIDNISPAVFCCLKRFFNRWIEPFILHIDASKGLNNQKLVCCYDNEAIKTYFETKHRNIGNIGNIENIENIQNISLVEIRKTYKLNIKSDKLITENGKTAYKYNDLIKKRKRRISKVLSSNETTDKSTEGIIKYK